jgi:transcriptional regulator with XRE-family HTH domain
MVALMPYKLLPAELCAAGTWPEGPFTEGGDPAARSAAAAAARLAAAITDARTRRRWSRADLAAEAGVGQHTVGRIEAGRTWPDLATVARLAHTLGLEIIVTAAGEFAPRSPVGATVPEQPSVRPPTARPSLPLDLGLTPGDGVTSAHVVEALLALSPRLRQDVERLMHRRRAGGNRLVARSGTRL